MTTAAEAIEAIRLALDAHAATKTWAEAMAAQQVIAAAASNEALRAILDRMAELERDAARWQFLEEEHQRIDRICALSWKASGDRHGSKWVNAQDIGRAVDVEIAMQRLPSAPDAKEQA